MQVTRRYWLRVAFALIGVAGAALAPGAGVAPAAAQSRDVLVFAAASLKNALDDVAAQWLRQTGKKIAISYAGSNNLIRQIELGAPADIFFSADTDWMDYGQQKSLIRPESRANLLGNRIVLVAPKDAAATIALAPGVDLSVALKGGRLAMANVDAVPAGKYGKAALEKLGAWDRIKDKIAQAESVRAALLLVSRGEAPLGIVYETDAASEPAVRIVATFPDDTHPPIIYPVALTKDSRNPDAATFLDFIRSPAARPAFERQGFTVLAEGGKRS
jgi:molybdate transport system substrate-binding protein